MVELSGLSDSVSREGVVDATQTVDVDAMVVRFEEVHIDGVCLLPNVNFKVLSRVTFGTVECVWSEKETRQVENGKRKIE